MTSLQRFILHGISGVHNYGCEAIIRGTEIALRSEWPDCQIVYLSQRPEEDRRALGDCNVEIWDHCQLPRLHPKRVLKSLLRRSHAPHLWLNTEKKHPLGPQDCVLSIGGDIFTLGPGPYPRSCADYLQDSYSQRLMDQGCRFILWGASIGPFDAWPESISHFRDFLRRTDLITVREPETYAYLESLGVHDNVVTVADPAFLMNKCDIPGDLVFEKGNGPILGVNLSPLSFLHVYAKEDMAAAFQEHIDALETLISELSVRVILIPHVIAPHMPRDDDYRFLKSIYDIISERHPDYIALLSPDLGAQRTKGVISHCDALLASRMHCGIAAVSQGIPTLFLSYSSKARGMAQYVYGDDTFCLGLNEAVGNTLVTRTRLLLDSRTQIASALSSRMEEFADMAKQGGRILKCRFRTE